jgi:hypothetical protein
MDRCGSAAARLPESGRKDLAIQVLAGTETVYWLWVSNPVDPAECEQSDGDTGSAYRNNESAVLWRKHTT